ncbi:MAG: glycosyl transferase, partial [Acidobacteria bacterium]|nr:glycosyl transferase [Acidobacteriota bacterium]
DLGLQREISWMTVEALSAWERLGAGNAAVIVVDRSTWGVLAWVGSTDYFDVRHSGAIDYAEVPRSPGSTLKPFIYATALDRGVITAATVLDDLHRGAGGIGNADFSFMGPMLPRRALANSRNVPAANLLAAIGLDAGYDILGRLGLHAWSVPAAHWGLGLAIGNMPVTLEGLVTAYTTLAGDGRLHRLAWLGDRSSPPGRRIFSEDTVRQITLFLSDPMARLPTFRRMGSLEYPFPVAVKTGTSSGYHDAWTVAWSRRYLVGVWVGDPAFRPMNHVTGSSSAARLVHRVLLLLHRGDADGLEDVGFPPPRGWVPVRLCAMTGKLATPACDHVVQEYFTPGRVPHERCRVHRRLAVDTRNGLLASPRTPPEDTELRTFTDLGPKYAEWQEAAHLPRPPTEVSSLGSGSPHPRAAAPPARLVPPERTARIRRVEIVRPERGLKVIRDPETPPRFATLSLEAIVDPPSEQLLWIVDGKPFKLVDYPYAVSWPLTPGVHTFQAEIPFTGTRTAPVRIQVF